LDIFLNGKTLEFEGITSETSLSEVVAAVEESLKGTGATVVEIMVDGEQYSPDDSEKIEELKIIEFEKIEILCATAKEMVELAISDGQEGLEHLEELALEVSADLRVGKVKDAMDKYLNFIDGIEWFSTMLKNADRAFAAAMAESSAEAERQNLIARLNEQTGAIQGAQEGEDWVGLADILEYEFSELFEDGRSLFSKILDAK
jgi:hypothetical protein